MQVTNLEIPGLKLIVPPRFEDERGFFSETYSEKALKDACHKFLDRSRIADGLIDSLQVLLDFTRLNGILGENRARGLLTLGRLIDLAGYCALGFGGLFKILEPQRELS